MKRLKERRANAWRAVAGACLLLAGTANADIIVPPGGTWSGGVMDLACTDVVVNGTMNLAGLALTNVRNLTIGSTGSLTLGSGGLITLAGTWNNGGSFTANNGGVAFVDTHASCPPGSIATAVIGNTTFHNLSIISASGKLIQFTANSTQTVTGSLSLQGQPGTPLRIESTTPGSVSAALVLTSTGTQSLANLAVHGMSAPTPGQWLAPGQTNQATGGTVSRWFGMPSDGGATPIPTLSSFSLAGLGLGLAALAARRRKNTRSHLP